MYGFARFGDESRYEAVNSLVMTAVVSGMMMIIGMEYWFASIGPGPGATVDFNSLVISEW